MAVLSDYTSGTITLANGSTAVTGTGTLFDVAKFREGDTLQIQNLTAVIASVNSNTSLTLTAPWTGTSLTNAPYRARYLPDGARVTAQATTLIELLGNGVLTNLAEIGVEDGKVPVGNAAGQYELVDTDEFGVQDPNGSLGKLAALTLGNRQILQTDGAGSFTLLSLAARQILQTDANGALKAIALAANKLINTDASGDILLSDITPLARSVLDDTTGAAMWNTMGGGGSLVPNGWSRSPNGLIMNWGNINIANGDQGILFPQAFPNQVFGVVIGAAQSTPNSATTFYGASADSYTLSSFAAHGRYIGNGGSVGQAAINASYIALGR